MPKPVLANANDGMIARLQDIVRRELGTALGDRDSYILADFPNHSNIGDSAIYMGELAALRELTGRSPSLVIEARDKDLGRLALDKSDSAILLHGGGNFGDLYPRHQIFREQAAKRLRHRKLVQLPQSIHYDDPDCLKRTADAINAHPDFTLMVRDQPSLELARSVLTCRIVLVPDMAFMIGQVEPAPAVEAVLCLMRADKERVVGDLTSLSRIDGSYSVVDWPKGARARRRLVSLVPTAARRLLPISVQGSHPASVAAYEALAARRVRAGLDLLSRGRMIITDRLHAHILSLLLGRDHVVLDNTYGKISRYSAAWTAGSLFSSATTIAQAVDQVAARLAASGPPIR